VVKFERSSGRSRCRQLIKSPTELAERFYFCFIYRFDAPSVGSDLAYKPAKQPQNINVSFDIS
jgi:hypothetical protein